MKKLMLSIMFNMIICFFGGITIFGTMRIIENTWPKETEVHVYNYICVIGEGSEFACREDQKNEHQ